MTSNRRWKALFSALVAIVAMWPPSSSFAFDGRSDVPIGSVIANFHATDYRGREWTDKDFADQDLLVVAFLGTQCPLAKLYSGRLVELEKEFSSRGVAFVAVDSNDQDALNEMAAYAKKHGMDFPFLKDAGQKLADSLGATRTPEVCLLDRERRLCYRGRIDDQYSIGVVREKATASDLREAIVALLEQRAIEKPQQPAVGCLIGRRRAVKEDSEVTFANQISRLIQNRCVGCHRAGDIGPMSLENYEDVAAWSEMILEVTQDERMPPWHASPHVGHFENDRRLSVDEKLLIQRWVEAGAPSGDLAQLPPPPVFTEGWQLSKEPDLVVEVSPKPFKVPATGEVRYQYFRVDPQLTEDRWVSEAELQPGNRAVVHHILVFIRPKGSRGAMDGERSFFFGYVPGTRVAPMPKGLAKKLPKDSELIFQVHYTPIGTAQEDHSRFGLIFADPQAVTHEVQTTSAVQVRLNIPPGEANYQTEAMLPEELPECTLLSMSPHMHLRGKSFRYTAIFPDGRKEPLLDIPRYDFNWQTEYRLTDGMTLPKGSRIWCEATFDNSANNLNNPNPESWVHWGDQTYEEMMIGYFHVSVPVASTDSDLPPSRRSRRDRLVPSLQQKPGTERIPAARQVFQELDRNQDGRLTDDEVPDRLKRIVERLDRNRDGILDEAELPK